MTVVGAHAFSDRSVTIGGAPDVWHTILELPASSLPNGGFRQLAFVAWSTLGSPLVRAVHSPNDACIQLGLRRVGSPQPFPETVCSFDVRGGQTNQAAGPFGRMNPVFWVYGRTSTGSNARGTWDADTDGLEIVARLFLSADPPGSLDAEFLVGESGILCFDLDAMDLADWFWGRHRDTTGQGVANNNDGSIRLHGTSTFSGVFDGSRDFLCFGSTLHRPAQDPLVGNVHGWQLALETAPSTYTAVVGEDFRCGTAPRGGARLSWRTRVGGGQLLEAPEDGWNLAIRGRELGVTVGSTTRTPGLFFDHEHLVIAGDALGQFAALRRTGGAAGAIYQDQGGLGFAPFEPNLPYRLTPVLFGNMRPERNTGAFQAVAYGPVLQSNTGAVGRFFEAFAYYQEPLEGIWSAFGRDLPSFAAGTDVQVRAAAYSLAGEFSPLATKDAEELLLAIWLWDDAVDFTPDNPPAVPPETAIVVPKESLATGALPDLTYGPDTWAETGDQPAREFEADDGTIESWPSYVGVRTTYEFTWTARTEAEGATVLDEASTWFRWTHPDTGRTLALFPDASLQVVQLPNRHVEVRGRFLDMIWTG